MESVADAALYGARGNSGIIFAQYFTGLSESVEDRMSISINEYVKASNEAVSYAYSAIEEPVEGTMITLMREWGEALTEETKKTKQLLDIFANAYARIEFALEQTKNQLEVLRKANVVDSGAKGFTCFVQGVLYYVRNGENIKIEDINIQDSKSIVDRQFDKDVDLGHVCNSDFRYCTECLLRGENINTNEVKSFLQNKGNSLVIAGNKRKCRIHIHTNEPADVFEYLYQKGTIIYQKVDDMYKQEAIVEHQRSKIALVTDSIADLPQSFIDEYQIHVVHMDILFKDYIYMDKLTIHSNKLLELSEATEYMPTTSQPNPKQIENLYD